MCEAIVLHPQCGRGLSIAIEQRLTIRQILRLCQRRRARRFREIRPTPESVAATHARADSQVQGQRRGVSSTQELMLAQSISWISVAVVGPAVSGPQEGLGNSGHISARGPAGSRRTDGVYEKMSSCSSGVLLYFLPESIHDNDARSSNYLICRSTTRGDYYQFLGRGTRHRGALGLSGGGPLLEPGDGCRRGWSQFPWRAVEGSSASIFPRVRPLTLGCFEYISVLCW